MSKADAHDTLTSPPFRQVHLLGANRTLGLFFKVFSDFTEIKGLPCLEYTLWR